MSFNPKLTDVAIVEQLIQMFKVLNVSGDMDKISLNGPKISTAQGRISGEKN